MKKSTEPSKDEMNEASASESTLNSKAEYFERLRKENKVAIATYVHIYLFEFYLNAINQQKFVVKQFSWLPEQQKLSSYTKFCHT